MWFHTRKQWSLGRKQKNVHWKGELSVRPIHWRSERSNSSTNRQTWREESQNKHECQSYPDMVSQLVSLESLAEFSTLLATNRSNQDEMDRDQRRNYNKCNSHAGNARRRRGENAYSGDQERSRSPCQRRRKSSNNDMFFSENERSSIRSYSIPEASKTRSRSFTSNVEILEEAECICPISHACPRRNDNELDCRSLVSKWKPWGERFDQDVLISARSWVPDPNATIATVTEMNEILSPLNEVANLPATSVRTLQKTFTKWFDAIITMKDRNVNQHLLDQTYAIESIQSWLDMLTLAEIKQKRMKSWFLEEMAIFLRNWKRGDFYCDTNRGLKVKEKSNGYSQQRQLLLDKKSAYYKSSKYYGQGDLINGEVWTSRLQMLRDGAHGEIQAGISGSVKHGARSIVTGKHNPSNKDCYADQDFGPKIDYVGTARKGSDEEWNTTNIKDTDMDTRPFDTSLEPTDYTQMLMRSLETAIPVRVFRSYKLAPVVKNRPRKPMYRFDGMYVVTGKTPRKEAQQIWSFRLERCPHQGKLRAYSDDPQRDDRGAPPGWTWYE